MLAGPGVVMESMTCKREVKAWMEAPFDLDASAVRPLKHALKGAGAVNLTVERTFISINACSTIGTSRLRRTANTVVAKQRLIADPILYDTEFALAAIRIHYVFGRP